MCKESDLCARMQAKISLWRPSAFFRREGSGETCQHSRWYNNDYGTKISKFRPFRCTTVIQLKYNLLSKSNGIEDDPQILSCHILAGSTKSLSHFTSYAFLIESCLFAE